MITTNCAIKCAGFDSKPRSCTEKPVSSNLAGTKTDGKKVIPE